MDYLIEAVALGVDAVVLSFCTRQCYKMLKTINKLIDAPTYEITEDLLKTIEDAPGAKIPYVVLRAAVKSIGYPIVSKNCPDIKGVIQKLSVREHKMTRAYAELWSENRKPLYQGQRAVPFSLSDNNCSIEIGDALSAELLDLDLIWDHYEPSHLGVLHHICGFICGVHEKGVQSTEEMLKEGSVITAVGELCLNVDGGLKLQRPKSGQPLFLTKLSKDNLIQKLIGKRNNLKMICAFLGVAGVVLGGFLLHKYLSKKKRLWRDLQLKERIERARHERRVAVRDENLTEGQRCVVCVHNPKEVILLPCGHVCLCEECSRQISNNCPVCRKKIRSKAAAFLT